MQKCDLAWAAGFFDGEGYIGVRRNCGYEYVSLQITQKDPRPLKRWTRIFGGSVNGPYRRVYPLYAVSYGDVDSRRIIELLFPFLSEPKTEQAHRVLEEVGHRGDR